MNLNNIETLIQLLEGQTASLKARLDITEETFVETEQNLSSLKELDLINKKAIELLNLVQKSTKELICNVFETIVTNALRYVYDSDDYEFKLVLDRRGAKPSMKFMLRTPDKQEMHDICSTSGGGEKDIIALALRFVMLEVSKNEGFLYLDEPFKRLDSEETWYRAIDFIKETQKDTKRQIIIIGHEKEKPLMESVKQPILIKKD